MRIAEGGLDDPRVVRFLAEHLEEMREISPPESVHALDLAALRAPGMRFWSVWTDADDLVATAALKTLDVSHAELKSMRTSAAFRGRGVAATTVRGPRLRGVWAVRRLYARSQQRVHDPRALRLRPGAAWSTVGVRASAE